MLIVPDCIRAWTGMLEVGTRTMELKGLDALTSQPVAIVNAPVHGYLQSPMNVVLCSIMMVAFITC